MKSVRAVTIFGCTDVGRVRASNEDAVEWDAQLGFAAVADGMGGHDAGDVAAAIAVRSLVDCLRRHDEEVASARVAGQGDAQAALRDAVSEANRAIYETSRSRPEGSTMGTTLALVWIRDRRVLVAHVGDSRVYRLRRGRLERLTQDHSLVEQLIAEGTLAPEHAPNHHYRNVITRALGVRPTVKVDVELLPVAEHDTFLICSDGLWNELSVEEMQAHLVESGGDSSTAARLVAAANARGGNDNISAVIVHAGGLMSAAGSGDT